MNTQDLIAELEFELISTSKLLNRVPADELDWRPHPKAMTLGQVAHHVAVIPVRYLSFADEGFTDIEELTNHHAPKDKNEILDGFTAGSEKAKALLQNVNDK